jgi:hypothetical protein
LNSLSHLHAISSSVSGSRIRLLAASRQCGMLARGHARLEATVDAVLASPGVASDVDDLAAGLDQLEDPPAEILARG